MLQRYSSAPDPAPLHEPARPSNLHTRARGPAEPAALGAQAQPAPAPLPLKVLHALEPLAEVAEPAAARPRSARPSRALRQRPPARPPAQAATGGAGEAVPRCAARSPALQDAAIASSTAAAARSSCARRGGAGPALRASWGRRFRSPPRRKPPAHPTARRSHRRFLPLTSMQVIFMWAGHTRHRFCGAGGGGRRRGRWARAGIIAASQKAQARRLRPSHLLRSAAPGTQAGGLDRPAAGLAQAGRSPAARGPFHTNSHPNL